MNDPMPAVLAQPLHMKTREGHGKNHGLLPLPLGGRSVPELVLVVKTCPAIEELTITHITTEEFPTIAMAAQPGLDFLVPNEFHILVAAPGESHYKGPCLAQFPGRRVDHPPRVAKVHLRLLPWLAFHSRRRLTVLFRRFDLTRQPVNRGVAAREAALQQPLVDRRHLYLHTQQPLDLITVALRRRLVLRRGLFR